MKRKTNGEGRYERVCAPKSSHHAASRLETRAFSRDSTQKEEGMKTMRFTTFLVVACMLVLLAGQSAFGAIKIVKFTVPSCE